MIWFRTAYNITKRVAVQLSRIVYHPLFIVLVTVGTVVLCISLLLSSKEIRSSSEIVTTLQKQVQQKQLLLKNTQTAVEKAKSPLAQEKIIRDELLQQKPGEYVVQIPDLPEPKESEVQQMKPLTPWEQWRALLEI